MMRCPVICSTQVCDDTRARTTPTRIARKASAIRSRPARSPVRDVAVDRELHQVRLRQLQHRGADDRRQRQRRPAAGTATGSRSSRRISARVVGLAEDLFVVHGHLSSRDSPARALDSLARSPQRRRAILNRAQSASARHQHSVACRAFICIFHLPSSSYCRELLFQQLLPVHGRVEAAARDQLVVRAALDDAAAVEHEDLIGVAHRRHAVRHDERRPLRASRRAAASGSPPRCRCPPPTAHRRGSRMPRIDHQRARDRRALLLPARQRDARARRPASRSRCGNASTSLSSRATAAAWRDTVARVARRAGLALRRHAERDVLGDRVGEQERLLRHEADRARAASPAGSRGRRRRRGTPCPAAARAAAAAG